MTTPGASTTPRWALLAGAFIAAVVATGVPGLAAILDLLDHRDAAFQALMAEIPLALGTAIFGALQTRAQFRQSARGVGALLLLLNAGVVFVTGMGFVLHDAMGTVDGGAAIVLGALLVFGAVLLQTALAGFSWWVIARNVRDAGSAGASGEGDARLAFSRWLFWLSLGHVALKLVSSGSLIFGTLGAVYAAVLAETARRHGSTKTTLPAIFAGLLAVFGFSETVPAWSRMATAAANADLPYCVTMDSIYNHDNDVLAKRVRAMPHIADAAADVFENQVTLYVVPLGGGPLDATTQAAIEKDIAGVACTFWDGKGDVRAKNIKVQTAGYATLDVTATFNAPEVVVPGAEQKIVDAVNAIFDWNKTGLPLVRANQRTASSDPYTPDIGGWVDYRVKEATLQATLNHLPTGTAPRIGHVTVVVRHRDGSN